MRPLTQVLVLSAFTSSILAFTLNNQGQTFCGDSVNRVGDIYNYVSENMPDTALFSAPDSHIACSNIARFTDLNQQWHGMCAYFQNSGGNIFSKTKILSMLEYIGFEDSCGSCPTDYPLLNNSFSILTVNWVPDTGCSGAGGKGCYFPANQIAQGSAPQNARGYAEGWCTFHLLQYQGNSGDGSLNSLVTDLSQPYTTYIDLQILDANHQLIGETWYQQSDSGQTWDLPSKLPAQFEVGVGTMQEDNITFAYNGVVWNSAANDARFTWEDGSNSAQNAFFANGFRSGNGGFIC